MLPAIYLYPADEADDVEDREYKENDSCAIPTSSEVDDCGADTEGDLENACDPDDSVDRFLI